MPDPPPVMKIVLPVSFIEVLTGWRHYRQVSARCVRTRFNSFIQILRTYVFTCQEAEPNACRAGDVDYQ